PNITAPARATYASGGTMPKPAPITPASIPAAPEAATPQPSFAPSTAPRKPARPAKLLPIAPEPPPPTPDPQPAARRRAARAPVRSAMNALRHGLTSQVLILTAQDEPFYLAHCRDFIQHYQPQGLRELHLTQQMADLQWRLYRVAAQEANMFALAEFDAPAPYDAGRPEINSALLAAATLREKPSTLLNISLYEQRLARSFTQLRNELENLQFHRKWEARTAKKQD
ncbi:MAG: hypothetical protein NTV70_26580, partial [Acidobacteria bacterium]|nr:hypothetical protein [Acidobacteriota bacterium]